mgnify:CR=1 FL=1
MSAPVAAKDEPQEDDDEMPTKKARGAGIKTCITCMHSSNEANPLTDGPHSSWLNWPWAHGCNAAPIGKQCRICALVFVLSGFSKSYAGLKELHKAMKSSNTLTDEFVNCGKKMIQLINDGVVKARVKGSVKDEVGLVQTTRTPQRAMGGERREWGRARGGGGCAQSWEFGESGIQEFRL